MEHPTQRLQQSEHMRMFALFFKECFTAYLIHSRWCSLNMHDLSIILEITSLLKRRNCYKSVFQGYFSPHYSMWYSWIFLCDHRRGVNMLHRYEAWPLRYHYHLPHHLLCLKYSQTKWKLLETIGCDSFFCLLIRNKNLLCTWGRSVQFCTRCTGPLAPVLLVTLLRGRAAAVLSQSSITVSSGCGCRKRAMSSNPIYQPPEAVRQSSSW